MFSALILEYKQLSGPWALVEHIGAPAELPHCSVRPKARESGCEAFDQNVAVEGLGQETDCSRLQRSRATDLNRKSRDENERHAMSLGTQVGLQFDAGH